MVASTEGTEVLPPPIPQCFSISILSPATPTTGINNNATNTLINNFSIFIIIHFKNSTAKL